MLHFATLVLALASTGGTPSASCNGADPTITDVTGARASSAGKANLFTFDVTVQNVGSKNQSGNVLQSVIVNLDGTKNGEKAIPPLKAGQKYTFPYDVQRAAGAGVGTTRVGLRFTMIAPPGISSEHCSANDDVARLVF
jgi:hypothetical protein